MICVAESTSNRGRRGAELHRRGAGKPVPVMVTVVPPAVEPVVGLMARYRGTGAAAA